MTKRQSNEIVIIRAIWWRQACFTLFLMICAIFCAFINFVGTFLSWLLTLAFLLTAILNLLDQIFIWSRMKIDADGYDLRTWFGRTKISHQQIDGFELSQFLHRKLIMVRLKKGKELEDDTVRSIPLPCAFGRPIEDVLKLLEAHLNKTPKAKNSSKRS